MSTTLKADKCFHTSTKYFDYPLIKDLREEFGPKGYALSLVILTHIRQEGTEARYNRRFRALITQEFPEFSENLVKMVIRRMTDADFLDKKAFKERHVLTPPVRFLVDTVQDIYSGSFDLSAPYYFVKEDNSVVVSEKTADSSEQSCNSSELFRNNSELFRINTVLSGNNTEYSGKMCNSQKNSSDYGTIEKRS